MPSHRHHAKVISSKPDHASAPLTPLWEVIFYDEFEAEFMNFDADAQDALLAAAEAVSLSGPRAGRPFVDSLKGSRHGNMKELRYKASAGSQVWRAAFAFDPRRKAVVLVAAQKQGTGQRRFYERLIATADERFDSHLLRLTQGK